MEEREYILTVESRYPTDRLVCAPISLTTNFVYHFRQCGRVRVRLSTKLILITSAAAMINDGLHANTHRRKTINNGTETKFRNFIDFLLLYLLVCYCCCCCCLPLAVHLTHRKANDEKNGRKTLPRVKQSSVDFAFSRFSSDIQQPTLCCAFASGSILLRFRFGSYRFFCSVQFVNMLVGSDFPSLKLREMIYLCSEKLLCSILNFINYFS